MAILGYFNIRQIHNQNPANELDVSIPGRAFAVPDLLKVMIADHKVAFVSVSWLKHVTYDTIHILSIYIYTVLEFATCKCPKKDQKPPVCATAKQRNYEGINTGVNNVKL